MLHSAIRHDEVPPRPVLRIAVPIWAPLYGKKIDTGERAARPAASREEFKRLLDAALNPSDLILTPMTRRERQQVATTRKIRSALYGMS